MIRVERKHYETGYAEYQLVVDGETVVEVTVLPPGAALNVGNEAARVAIGSTRPLCPDEAERLANIVMEAAAYATAMNTREGVTCE